MEDTWEEKALTFAGAAFTGLVYGGLVYVVGDGFVSEQHEGWVALLSILTGLAVGFSVYRMEAADLEDSMINAYRQIAAHYSISLE